MSQPVLKELEKILANTFALYVKTLNYHWNITGCSFMELHLLFEDQYKNLAEAGDLIAEQIRALGHKVHATLTHFEKNSDLKEPNENLSPSQMIQDLYNDHQVLCQHLNKAANIANQNNDKSSEDITIERIRYHEKASWMLKSYLSSDSCYKPTL